MRQCYLLFPSVICLFACPAASANSIVNLTCDGKVIAKNVAAGLNAVFACPLGNGMAQFGVEQSAAGNNFFLDTMSVIWDTSAEPQGSNHSATFKVTTTPTWNPKPKEPPPAVPTFLELDGRVQIPDPTGSLRLDLIGFLGGPLLEIKPPLLTSANCRQCIVTTSMSGNQFTDPTADEFLFITSVGRTVYRTSSEVFQGSIPEPPSSALFGLAVGALLYARRLRHPVIGAP